MQTRQRSSQPIANPTVLALAGNFGKIAEYGSKPPEPDVFKSVYPMINAEAYALMMDRYRQHVDEYNMTTEWENVDIHNFNQNVELYLSSDKASDIQKAYAANFPKLNEELIRTREYNAAADVANEKYGPIIKKRPHHIIKPVTEQFFANFLHVYNTQLEKHNVPQIQRGLRTPRPLPALKVNSLFITQLRRAEGMFSLKVCSKTVRTHRQHLEVAGVFVNSTFRGAAFAVEVEINPEILVIYDDHTQKLTRPENQPIPKKKRKTLPDDDEITGASKEEYKEKNDAPQSFGNNVSAKPTGSSGYKSNSYKVTGSNVENSPVGAAAGSKDLKKIFAQKLRERIMHPQELAEALAKGDFNDYTPIPAGELMKLAYDGVITSDEFRELVIQDLLKQSAKIWIGRTPYPGSWKKAINLWMKYKFLNFAGNSMSPPNIFDYVAEYRWRLEQARRWFLRSNVKVRSLFPSDYFDPTRKNKNEIGFEGTAHLWKRKKNDDEKQPIEKNKLEKNAAQRQKRLSNTARYNNYIETFLRGRLSPEKLWEMVSSLPPEYLRALPGDLRKKQAAAQQKMTIT